MARAPSHYGSGSTLTPQTHPEALQRTDAAFFEALLGSDIAGLETLLAEEFVIVDVASGSVHPRAAFLDAIRAGAVVFEEIKTFPDEAVTRLAGPATGIIIGRTAMSIRGAEDALTEVASRYTHVFEAHGSNWRLLSAQGTPIAGA